MSLQNDLLHFTDEKPEAQGGSTETLSQLLLCTVPSIPGVLLMRSHLSFHFWKQVTGQKSPI